SPGRASGSSGCSVLHSGPGTGSRVCNVSPDEKSQGSPFEQEEIPACATHATPCKQPHVQRRKTEFHLSPGGCVPGAGGHGVVDCLCRSDGGPMEDFVCVRLWAVPV